MTTIRAHVRNGQIVPDEPLDLPEGAEVDVVPRVAPTGSSAGGFLERHRRILQEAWREPEEPNSDIDDVVYGDPHGDRG